MDQQIEEYIKGLITQCLNSPGFASLDVSQKNQIAEKLKDYFNEVVISVLIDNLSDAQVDEIKDLSFRSPSMIAKLEQFSGQIPGFLFLAQEKLESEATNINQTAKIPQ